MMRNYDQALIHPVCPEQLVHADVLNEFFKIPRILETTLKN